MQNNIYNLESQVIVKTVSFGYYMMAFFNISLTLGVGWLTFVSFCSILYNELKNIRKKVLQHYKSKNTKKVESKIKKIQSNVAESLFYISLFNKKYNLKCRES